MTIDPYAVCPGGTGKKIKFCCSDLVSELDKIQRMIEGDQRVACLEYITKLEGKHPQRACLMGVRSILELSLEKVEEAAATIDAFVGKYPENPVALAQSAVVKALQGKPQDAIPLLLRAVDLSGDEVHPHVYRAVGSVAYRCLATGYLIPGRSLIILQLGLSRGRDERALAMYTDIQKDLDLPLLLKEELGIKAAPEGAPWKFEFDRAVQRLKDGEWAVAGEKFAALIPLAGQSPALWENLALLRGWLADYPGMVEALRKSAALDVPFDDAVEAEARAQLLDPGSIADGVELIEVEYAIVHQSDLEERFSADRQMERMPFDPQGWDHGEDADKTEPPPRALYTLLNRPPAPTTAGLTHDKVPEVVGGVQLYGRQTDRPERLVLETDRDRMAEVEPLLKRIAGDALGERTATEERVTDRANPVSRLMQWDWRLPDDAPLEQRKELYAAERRDRVLNRLPKLPLAQIGGQSLEQAVAEPAGRIRAAAVILLRELGVVHEQDAEVYNELRRKLGLPTAEPLDPAAITDLLHLSVARLHRLQMDKLDDEMLLKLYVRAGMISALRAVVKLGVEILRRPALGEKVDFAEIHGFLANFAPTREQALRHIEEARALAQKARQSSARWDLEELRLYTTFGDVQGAARLFDHIRREHIREEGVAEALSQILVSADLVDRSGRVLLPPVAQASPILVPGGPTSGKILTPDSAASSEERKPVLWTPGME